MSKNNKITIAPEWSCIVDTTEMSQAGLRLSISPPPEVHQQLIQRLGIVTLEGLEADVALNRATHSAVLHVTGNIRAKIRQNCVVTLEPIDTEINENFEAWFTDPAHAVSLAKVRQDKKVKKGNVEMPILDESEDPEPIIDGKIDLGELVTQHLSLAINPYPHKEGVQFEVGDDAPKPDKSDLQSNPFAALKDWKARLKQGDS